jgi:prepilin-type N-terminal cleavage/methylation domain-containing protein
MTTAHTTHPFRAMRGFTLTELMIAVVVLLVVILATSRIFQTASGVTGIGQARASIIQEAAAIERQIREDFEKITTDGVFLIRSVRVANDIHLNNGGPLLNPALPPDAFVRADQLLFFTTGLQSSNIARVDGATYRYSQGPVSRVYWGHAFQLPQALPADPASNDIRRAHDPAHEAEVYPWTFGPVAMQRTLFGDYGGTGTQAYQASAGNPNEIPVVPPPAQQWLLARQDVMLADDDTVLPYQDSKSRYMRNPTVDSGGVTSARSVFRRDPRTGSGGSFFYSSEIRNGRVDCAASRLDDIRGVIIDSGGSTFDWDEQRNYMAANLLYYPRAERIAPSMDRVDQALTTPVIGSGCSNFIVEWTYRDLKGLQLDAAGNVLAQPTRIYPSRETPWFSLFDQVRGSAPYRSSQTWETGEAIYFDVIERQYFLAGTDNNVEVYESFFGYNQTEGLDALGQPDPDLAYTPWPDAVRITMTLHDPEGRLPEGVTFQFVVNLPERVSDAQDAL